MDDEVQAPGPSRWKRRGPLLGVAVLATVVLVAVVAVSRGRSDREGEGADPEVSASVEITSGTISGVDGLSQVVSVGDRLVGFSFGGGQHPAWSSGDRGRTWQPSTGLPESSLGYHLMTVGDGLLVADKRNGSIHLPALWVSEDGGQTFIEAEGLKAPDTGTQVRSVVAVDDELVAFGIRNRPTQTDWRWTSSDGGRTWSGAEVDAGNPEVLGPFVVAGGTLFAVRNAMTDFGSGLVRSDDDGRTWSAVRLPGRRGENPEDLISSLSAVDGHVVASSKRQSFLADDATLAWRLMGPAPSVPDDAGALPPDPETGAVELFEIDGDHLVAKIGTYYDMEHQIDRLGWSGDGGATWQAADMGVSCIGDVARALLGAPVRVGGALVASWNCSGAGDRGGRLLISGDGGRTWHPDPTVSSKGADVSPPVAVDGHAVALTAANGEQATDGWIDVTQGE